MAKADELSKSLSTERDALAKLKARRADLVAQRIAAAEDVARFELELGHLLLDDDPGAEQVRRQLEQAERRQRELHQQMQAITSRVLGSAVRVSELELTHRVLVRDETEARSRQAAASLQQNSGIPRTLLLDLQGQRRQAEHEAEVAVREWQALSTVEQCAHLIERLIEA